MKITRNSSDQLIVEERPWIIGLILIAVILVLTGVGLNMVISGDGTGLWFLLGTAIPVLFLFIFVRRVQVVFHRPGGWVEIRRQNLRSRSTVRHKLSEIASASVETSQGGDTPTHRVVLHIPKGQSAGKHPLTKYYVSGRGSEKAAKAINSWLS